MAQKFLKINENNSHLPIDKLKTLCYYMGVNNNHSQTGGDHGNKAQAVP
jgi:hypothetical protein